MAKFKAGDKVSCTDASQYGYINRGDVYTVVREADDGIVLEYGGKIVGEGYEYDVSKFELVEEAKPVPVPEQPKAELTLKYGGIGITLDPNIPFSRKFAEVFLNVVYEGGGQ